MQKFFKSNLPHIVAIISFILISLAYNMPLLKGKKLKQEDMTQVEGMTRELKVYDAATGENALWTNGLFGGMPAYQVFLKKPNIWISHLNTFLTQVIPQPASLIFLLMLCFYILLSTLKIKPLPSAIGAFAFAFSSYNFIIIDVGHITKVIATAYMALVIAGFILLYKGKYIQGFLLTMVGFALEIYSYHYQVTYYLGILLIIFVIIQLVEAVKGGQLSKFFKASALALGAIIIAIGTSFTSIAITQEYQKSTMRGTSALTDAATGKAKTGLDKEYAYNWSYGISETFTLLIPNFKGGPSGPIPPKYLKKISDPNIQQALAQSGSAYFGDQPGTAGPTYFGAIIMFLFVLGLIMVKSNLKWWLLIGSVLFTMLAWGKNLESFSNLFFDYFPLYNKFRAVSMMLLIPSLCVPFLAILGLVEMVNNPEALKSNKWRTLIISFGITGGLCLLMYVMPTVFNSFNNTQENDFLAQIASSQPDLVPQYRQFFNELANVRIAIFKDDALRSFIFILLAALSVYLYASKKIKEQVMYILLGALVVIDLWSVNTRYLNKEDFVNDIKTQNFFIPTQADNFILKDVDPNYRVLDLTADTYNSNRASYFHKSLGGYHPAKLGRFEDIKLKYLLDSTGRPSVQNINVLNMFNVKYFIYNQQNGEATPQVNMESLGNAWFVSKATVVNTSNEELGALKTLDTRNTAVIHNEFSNYVASTSWENDSTDYIKLTSYKPNELAYTSMASSDKLAIFSEIYYPNGWNAYIDGTAVPHIRANYILRALNIPAGKHSVVFKFEPAVFKTGESISLVFSILFVLILAGGLFMLWKKNPDV